MNSSNPVFRNKQVATSNSELEDLYNSPSATNAAMRRMTMDDVVIRTGMLFAIVVIAGALAWVGNVGSGLVMISAIGGMVLGFYNSFARKVHPAAVMVYAGLEGIFLGAVSHLYNTLYNGIVGQAVLVTAVTFFSVLVLYSSKKVRVTPKMYRIGMISIFTYMGIGLLNFVLSIFGYGHGYGFYGVQGLGLLLSTFGVALAAFFILLDFDQVEKTIAAGAPEIESWRMGFGLMVTIIWLYLQILQLLASLRDR